MTIPEFLVKLVGINTIYIARKDLGSKFLICICDHRNLNIFCRKCWLLQNSIEPKWHERKNVVYASTILES